MSDLVTTQIFASGEKNITATKMNNIIGGTVIQPDFFANKPVASTVNPTDNLLILSGGAYAQAPFSTVVNAVGASMTPQITAVRLNSFNSLAMSNCAFEVDQRNVGATISAAATGTFGVDRWKVVKAGTMVVSIGRQTAAAGEVKIPGTNFFISSNFLRMTLTTQQASLGASDLLQWSSVIEGPNLREIFGDVHSVSLLVRSSVANLKFGFVLQDPGATRSLTKLCTIPSANTWTLITLPNIPVWASGGGWSGAPGTVGYNFMITLAAGSTVTTAANDTWQSANVVGAIGQDNFASKPVSSTFDLAFAQHEPGNQSTQLMDLPFIQAQEFCARYYQKSYDYSTAVGAVTGNGEIGMIAAGGTTAVVGPVRFNRRMAKVPTVTIYNPATGAANSIRQLGGTNFTVTGALDIGETGFDVIAGATGLTQNSWCFAHYIADTLW